MQSNLMMWPNSNVVTEKKFLILTFAMEMSPSITIINFILRVFNLACMAVLIVEFKENFFYFCSDLSVNNLHRL